MKTDTTKLKIIQIAVIGALAFLGFKMIVIGINLITSLIMYIVPFVIISLFAYNKGIINFKREKVEKLIDTFLFMKDSFMKTARFTKNAKSLNKKGQDYYKEKR